MVMPPMAMGTFQLKDKETIIKIVDTAVESGCRAFDTSPSYGTEAMLGKALKRVCFYGGVYRNQLYISNKIDGWQMYCDSGDIEKRIDGSLKIMELDYFDLLLIHWPFEKYIQRTWDCMEKLKNKGKVKQIGICNVDYRKYKRLMNMGIVLAPEVVQNEISPLRACVEDIALWKKENVKIQAYSPLCRMHEKISNSEDLNILSQKYEKSVAQIVLRWHIQRGLVPIFTSKNRDRIVSNLDLFKFSLDDGEMSAITNLDEDYKIFPESFGCPGY